MPRPRLLLPALAAVWLIHGAGRLVTAAAPQDIVSSVRLPASDTHYQRVKDYVEEVPQPDYQQASEAAREAFRDMKFGVRIHWGVYCLWETGESWPLLGYSNEK